MGFSIKNNPFGGTPFWETLIFDTTVQYVSPATFSKLTKLRAATHLPARSASYRVADNHVLLVKRAGDWAGDWALPSASSVAVSLWALYFNPSFFINQPLGL